MEETPSAAKGRPIVSRILNCRPDGLIREILSMVKFARMTCPEMSRTFRWNAHDCGCSCGSSVECGNNE